MNFDRLSKWIPFPLAACGKVAALKFFWKYAQLVGGWAATLCNGTTPHLLGILPQKVESCHFTIIFPGQNKLVRQKFIIFARQVNKL